MWRCGRQGYLAWSGVAQDGTGVETGIGLEEKGSGCVRAGSKREGEQSTKGGAKYRSNICFPMHLDTYLPLPCLPYLEARFQLPLQPVAASHGSPAAILRLGPEMAEIPPLTYCTLVLR
jgi:hypothetical protein